MCIIFKSVTNILKIFLSSLLRLQNIYMTILNNKSLDNNINNK